MNVSLCPSGTECPFSSWHSRLAAGVLSEGSPPHHSARHRAASGPLPSPLWGGTGCGYGRVWCAELGTPVVRGGYSSGDFTANAPDRVNSSLKKLSSRFQRGAGHGRAENHVVSVSSRRRRRLLPRPHWVKPVSRGDACPPARWRHACFLGLCLML